MKKKHSGLTLVELVAAVTIFALLTALLMLAVNAAFQNWRNAKTRAELSARGMALLDILGADLQDALEISNEPNFTGEHEYLLDPIVLSKEMLWIKKPDAVVCYDVGNTGEDEFKLFRSTNETDNASILATGVHDVTVWASAHEALDVRITLLPPDLKIQNPESMDDVVARHGVVSSRRVHVPNQLAALLPGNRLRLPPREVTLSGEFNGGMGWTIEIPNSKSRTYSGNGGPYELKEVPSLRPVLIQPIPALGEGEEGSFEPAWRVWLPGTPTTNLNFTWVESSDDAENRVTVSGRVTRGDLDVDKGVRRMPVRLWDGDGNVLRIATTDNNGYYFFRVSSGLAENTFVDLNPPWPGGSTVEKSPTLQINENNFECNLRWTPPEVVVSGTIHGENEFSVAPIVDCIPVNSHSVTPVFNFFNDTVYTLTDTKLFDWQGVVKATGSRGPFNPTEGHPVATQFNLEINGIDFYAPDADAIYVDGYTYSYGGAEPLAGIELVLNPGYDGETYSSNGSGYYFIPLEPGFTGTLTPVVPPNYLLLEPRTIFIPRERPLLAPTAPVRQDFTLHLTNDLVTLTGNLFPEDMETFPFAFTNNIALTNYPVLFLTETNGVNLAEFPVVYTSPSGAFTNRVAAPWTGVVLPATTNLFNAGQLLATHVTPDGVATNQVMVNLSPGLFSTNHLLAAAFDPPAHVFTNLAESANNIHFTATNNIPNILLKNED